jgi:hypothetical protein
MTDWPNNGLVVITAGFTISTVWASWRNLKADVKAQEKEQAKTNQRLAVLMAQLGVDDPGGD